MEKETGLNTITDMAGYIITGMCICLTIKQITDAYMRNFDMLRLICFIWIIFTTQGTLLSSNAIKYISNVDGLTNNSVNCILEDNENTIWIGTWDGLNAYNGRDIITFRYSKNNSNSISNNIIRQIAEHKEHLWIATDNGINRLDKKNHRITRYYLNKNNRIPNQEKSFILGKSLSGEIFCLIKGSGIFRYQKSLDDFVPIKIGFAGKIKDFTIDQSDRTLFLLGSGVVKYSNSAQLLKGITEADLQTIQVNTFVSKMFLSSGYLVLNDKHTLTLISPDFTCHSVIKLDMQKEVSQVISQGTNLHIGFIEGGCISYNIANRHYEYVQELQRQLSIFTLYAGSQNILWVGSDGQGLIQLYDYKSLFKTVHTTHAVRSFCENNEGNILVGTKGSGIQLFNVETQQLSSYLSEERGLISNSVYAMRRHHSGDIFIGTEGAGINVLMKSTGRLHQLKIPVKYPNFKAVYSLHFTNGDSLLWVGTSGHGLIKMDIVKERGNYFVSGFRQYTSTDKSSSLNNDVVYAVAYAPNDYKVWFGTRGGGLYQIDTQNNEIRSLEDIDSRILLTNNDVLSLQCNESDIWIGTSYGLNRLNNNRKEVRLIQYTDEKLNNKTIHGILRDENNDVWISTNQGLSQLNISNGKTENFTMNDGLQNDEFSDGAFFKDKHGFLYFGGVSGFNYFDPKKMRLRDFDAPLGLNSLKILNVTQNINERIVDGVLQLNYDERFVSFTFVTKEFINNENCEYAYRFQNHSDDWVNLGNNATIFFTQLPPGKYLLEVKSTNGDRVWGTNRYKVQINVGYPWWLGFPALMLYGVLCVVLFFIARSIVRNRIRLSRQIFIAQTEKQHEQRIYESRLNFFTNVAHEFFTPLTLIYAPAQHMLEQPNLAADARKYLQIIMNNAQRMQRLISELMEFRKAKSENMDLHPENINIRELIEYASNNYVDILQENKIDFRMAVLDVTEIYSDRNALEKIVFNLLSNALKYTPRYGFISLKVFQDEANGNAMHLKIQNSGKGMTDQQMIEVFDKFKIFNTPRFGNSVSNGIGLNLTKSLTKLLGGDIYVDSELGKHVEFTVIVPALRAKEIDEVSNEHEANDKEMVEHYQLKPRQDTIVLVVEDDVNIGRLLKDVLTDYTVRTVQNGVDALHEIEKNHPDIILSDILMPNMGGIQLIDKLKSDSRTSYIPIIGISAKSSVEDQINAFNHGVDLYITKPFHPRQLISSIENLLSRQTMLRSYFNSSFSSVKVKNGIDLYPEDKELIDKVTSFIKSNIYDESLSPSSIAEFVGVSKATLYRKFKEIMDKTPSEFIRGIRLDQSARLLKSTKLTATEIMFKCGFSNKSYFYRKFLKQYGVSPIDYRNQVENNES